MKALPCVLDARYAMRELWHVDTLGCNKDTAGRVLLSSSMQMKSSRQQGACQRASLYLAGDDIAIGSVADRCLVSGVIQTC
jgi:hypothetical protein